MTNSELRFDGIVGSPMPTGSTMATRAAVSSIAGSALEWLDFAAYGAIAATVLPELFFPTADPMSGSLAAFATFTVGFVARPLGGLFCGILGDRIGRRSTLIFTLMLMGLASFAIGALPTYASIGVWAPSLLVIMRFAQGFALGGEVTGSQLLTMEHAPPNKRGYFSSFIAMGSPLAQVLANAMLFILVATLTAEQFKSFGWRIPFLISFILIGVGLYIRRQVSEPPVFTDAKLADSANPQVGKTTTTIIRLALVWAGLSVAYFVAAVFSLSYITKSLGVSQRDAFTCLIVGHLFSMVMMAAGGLMADRIGRRRTMLLGTATLACATAVFFPLLNTGNIWIIGVSIAGLLGIMQFHAGVQPAYFAEMFPPRTRYSGSAVAYNVANLVGSSSPMVATLLLGWANGSSWIIVVAGVIMAIISFVAVAIGPETLSTMEIRT